MNKTRLAGKMNSTFGSSLNSGLLNPSYRRNFRGSGNRGSEQSSSFANEN